MAIFKPTIVETAVKVHNKPGREAWMYKPMTDKQRDIVAKHVPASDLDKIDRGVARDMLQIIFERQREAREEVWAYSGDLGDSFGNYGDHGSYY